MRTHFHNEMAELRQAVLALGHRVGESVVQAVEALRASDQALAAKVMRADREIDCQEVRNEEACLKIIALHQPVADDLRYLVVMLKVNHELERIGDLAADLAETVHLLRPGTCERWESRLAEMAEDACQRLRRALDALVERDARQARDLWLADAEINVRTHELQTELQEMIASGGGTPAPLFGLLAAVAHVERMADHVKNIAKDVIYLSLGEIVRHRSRNLLPEEEKGKTRVLFVCVHNSARSQMAEAWLNHLHGHRFAAESAGLEPGQLNPHAVAAMREQGIDISGRATRDVFEVVKSGARFDYLITVCDEATAEKCPPALGTREELHWSFRDPSGATGAPEEQLAFVREVRDAIRRQIEAWVASLDA